MRLVVRRVDRDEKVDLVVHASELVYVITPAGRRHVSGLWNDKPIRWPARRIFVALANSGLYTTQERSLMPLRVALGPSFVMLHTGVAANLDRVRFVSRHRPLLLGFPRLGSADPKDALWAVVTRGRARGVLDQLGWIHRSARDDANMTRNGDELDVSEDAPVEEGNPMRETFGRGDDDDDDTEG